jgi:hypothetical protein
MVRYVVNSEDKSATSVLLPWSYEACRWVCGYVALSKVNMSKNTENK